MRPVLAGSGWPGRAGERPDPAGPSGPGSRRGARTAGARARPPGESERLRAGRRLPQRPPLGARDRRVHPCRSQPLATESLAPSPASPHAAEVRSEVSPARVVAVTRAGPQRWPGAAERWGSASLGLPRACACAGEETRQGGAWLTGSMLEVPIHAVYTRVYRACLVQRLMHKLSHYVQVDM